jgi:hypothetical protein
VVLACAPISLRSNKESAVATGNIPAVSIGSVDRGFFVAVDFSGRNLVQALRKAASAVGALPAWRRRPQQHDKRC